ncbi:MAG: CBS domain-containing protein [Burkholderiales bacterium]|nr:CBS domain-containing protein [Burkholderiales bacterium]
MTRKEGFLDRRLAGEQQVLARPLRALVQKPPVVCREEQSIREAVAMMHAHDVGSIVVVDATGAAVGVFTTNDLVASVAGGLDERPISEAMSRPAFALPAHAMAYEAALAMTGQRIRHVLVTEGTTLIGVVSERDLFSLQRLGLGEITTEIRLAGTVELLVGLAAEIRKLARLLVDEGVAAEQLTHFISVLNDRLCQRILEIERKNHQWEQLSWCWLAFGSEGRFEQTFSTDQDNGIVFVAHDGARPDAVRDLLLPFARRVNDALDACGFPLCKGNVMASNPKLCLSVDEWKHKIRGWVERPEPLALLDAAICLDFRALHGDATLAAALREWIHPLAKANPAFLRLMAENALESRPPLGVIRDFATDDDATPHAVNLKLKGARPFIDAARIYALAQGLSETNTAARLTAARAGIGMGAAEADGLVRAFFVVQGLRLRKQATLAPGEEGANRIDPDRLDDFERRILKEAFLQARKLQSRLALDYQV